MQIKIYLLLFSLFIISTINAQKKSVGFAPFTYNASAATQEAATNIYNFVVQAFHATQRFSVKDRLYGYSVISEEQELIKNENFIDAEVLIKRGKIEGAEWMVSGQILAAQTAQRPEGGYHANITFFIRVYDVVTGELVASEIISPNGRMDLGGSETIDEGKLRQLMNSAVDKFSASSEADALTSGMTGLLPHIKSFVRENFPYEFYEFKINPSESGPKQILVRGSEKMGAERDQIFQVVYLESIPFGDEIEIAKRVKGELKIVETAGKILYMEPRNKKNESIISFMQEHKKEIFIRESGKKATFLDGIDSSKRKSKSKKKKNTK